MNTDMINYYKERAREYERIYLKPERQVDIVKISELLQNMFAEKSVFEIACGTGFWTERIAQTAKNILATDINEAVLEIAKNKHYPGQNVKFRLKDVFSLDDKNNHEALFGGFIWSHIKLQESRL